MDITIDTTETAQAAALILIEKGLMDEKPYKILFHASSELSHLARLEDESLRTEAQKIKSAIFLENQIFNGMTSYSPEELKLARLVGEYANAFLRERIVEKPGISR